MSKSAGNSTALNEARALIRTWMREMGLIPTGSTGGSDEELIARFLTATSSSGFALETTNGGTATAPAWVGYWTFRGSSFEGFRQPADSPSRETAVLLACAALLRNEWCRTRLPGPGR